MRAHAHLAKVHAGVPTLPVKLIGALLAVLFVLALLLALVAASLHRRRTRADFGAPGLYGVVGRMGGGKSYFMAYMAWMARESSGRLVYTNYTLTGSERYHSWAELIDIPHCSRVGCSWKRVEAGECPSMRRNGGGGGPLVLMDEADLWFSSEAWRSPVEVNAWLKQLRKMEITMCWATQHEEFLGRRLRRLTYGYWKCVRYRQGHQFTLFDAVSFGKAKPERLARMNHVRKAEVMGSYNTLEIIEPSVEWGDGAGFEDLRVRPRVDPGERPVSAPSRGGAGRPGLAAVRAVEGGAAPVSQSS